MTKKKQQPPRYVASKREAGTKPREASARKNIIWATMRQPLNSQILFSAPSAPLLRVLKLKELPSG